MRISDNTRFPHPVLNSQSDDFTSGFFDVQFDFKELLDGPTLQADYRITLTEDGLRELVTAGTAVVGCIVRCEDTYLTELRPLSWPEGRIDFKAGSLVNRVYVRPVVWLKKPLDNWDPGTIHREFSPPVSFNSGAIVAIAPEHMISIGRAKLQPLESIFELRRTELPEGHLQIDLDCDRIAILVPGRTYDAIGLLRGQTHGHAVLMNGIYLPVVMEVLDALRGAPEQYSTRRWHRAFFSRCDGLRVTINESTAILETAQTLLDYPSKQLESVAAEETS